MKGIKGIKFLKVIVISLLWLFIFFNNLGAYEKNPAEISNQIDLWYGEFHDLYQQAQYTNAEDKLNKIIKTLDSDPYLESWRRAYQKQPTRETVYAMFKVLEGQPQREQGFAFIKGIEPHRQREEITQREQKSWEKIALAQKYKEEQLRAKEEELERRRQELKLRKEELEQKRQEQLIASQEKALWQREENLKRIALAKKEQQFKPRQEEQLAKQREERIKQFVELKAQQEQQLKAKQEELARKKEEGLQARQDKLKQAAEEKAKKEEQKRLKAEAGLKEKQQELVLKEAQRKARQEEIAQRREERLKEIARAKEEKQAQLRAHQEEKLKLEAERKAEKAQLKAQKEKEAQEKRVKLETERKAREEELARQREERLNQQQELKAQREEERKAKEEALAREKEERLKQQQELKAKQEQERKAKQEEKARVEAERKTREAELKAQKEKEAQEKRLKLETERKAREEELAKQKEERLKQQQELKVKREQELKAKQEELARKKEEELKRAAELKQQKEAEQKTRQEELTKQKEERERQLAEEKAKREQERKAKQEELARQKEERLKQQQELKAKQEQERKAKQEELARKKEEELEIKVNAMKRATAQEKAMTEVSLKKRRRDQAKLKKIEELWVRARRLYEQGMYAEAIKGFEELIKLEGNPRIKYTPFAKEFIDKAKNNLIQKNKVTLYKGIEQIEKEMVNEVLKRQVPPYIEPPQRTEQKEPTPLIEPPALRKKLKATKITMDFDKVGLKSVIAFLSQESGINFVASQRVLELAPVVSVRFKDTSLDEVIKYITKNLGLVYRIDKEIVWVAHPEEIANEPMETRVYYLTRGGGLFTEFSPMSTGTTETGLGGSSAQINKVWTIEDTLKEVVSWPSDSKISYDKRINALIVRNTPQNLQMLEDMLYSLDIEPLQVLIEARFLEVDITDTKELGLDWNLTGGDYALKQREGVYKKGIGSGSGVDFTAFTRAAEGLNLTYKGMLTNSQFQAVLHALEETKKIKTLSSPRITTLNNQLATMKVVDEWIYPTRYEYEIVQSDDNGDGDFSDAGETTYKNVPKDFLRRDVGILLKVIPSVGADKKTISLSLVPEVSEGTADGFTYTGDVKLPKFTSRNLSTTVIVNSGETVVLGGLIKESRTKTVTKVPVLGNIPLLGAFFKKNADSIERKNLLIFVTAKVLSPSGEEVVVAQK